MQTAKQLKTISKLKKEADRVYSLYIRKSASLADFRGYGKCYTCMRVIRWQELQAGHYLSRSYNKYRFDPRNVKPQCVSCNVFKKGNMTVYAIKLINEYGVDLLHEFEANRHKEHRFTQKDLLEIINKYKDA